MQKKRKSRKAKQKSYGHKKSPWSYQSKQDKQDTGPTKQHRQKQPETAVESAEVANLFANMEDMMQGLQNFMQHSEFFEYAKPIVEIHFESEVLTRSATKIMTNANKAAGLMVTKEDVEADARHLFGKVIFADLGLQIDDLDRVVVREDDAGAWIAQYIFSAGAPNQQIIATEMQTEAVPFNPSNAELMIESVIGLSLFDEGKINPENSVQQRTFKFDEATVTVNKNLFMHVREDFEQEENPSDEPDLDIGMFNAFMFVCGGKVTEEKLLQFDDDLLAMLDIGISYALLQGVKQWPLETAD